jgi:integrase
VFELAVTDRLIAANPAKGLKSPRRDVAPIKPIDGNELQALLDSAPAPFRAAIVLGAGLGLRLGEAAGLSIDRVDFLRRTVRVDRQWQQLRGTVPGAFVPPKSASSARVIPAAQGVLDELAHHIEQYGRGATIVHNDGQPLSAPQWEYQMRVTRKRAGLSGLTFHDLRHYYASALISAGCSVKAVQTALGHASASMTLDVYGHLWPGDEDRIRAAVDDVFGRASAAPETLRGPSASTRAR